MSALIVLVLAAAELTPPPVVEASPEPEPAAELVPASGPDVGAEAAFIAVQGLNGAWLGLNVCGALGCFDRIAPDPSYYWASGLTGAAAGLGLSFLGREVASDWGRALLIDSGSVVSAIASLYVASSMRGLPSMEARYGILLLTNAALFGGTVLLAKHVSPRAELVGLVLSTAGWGAILGGLAAGLTGQSSGVALNVAVLGAVFGGIGGALLAASVPTLTARRIWISNGAALAAGLVLGMVVGGVQLWSQLVGNPANPALPYVAMGVGIAGGFAFGFAIGEE